MAGVHIPTYPLSKKYTDETVAGGGAIKGKNLVVTSIESITGGKRINVQWTLDNGTVLTDHVDLENGEDGKGIKSVAINAEEHLIITYTDDTTSDAGKIEIQSAVDSVNGETGDVVLVLTDIVNVGSNLTYNSTTKTLSADAQAQVQADWEQSDNTQADYIKNKPTLGTASEKDAINAVLAGSPSLPTGGAVKTAIDEAVSGAYHHAGTKTVAELTSALLVEANDGNVYNMTDSGVTTADFIEGAGKPIAIGDNVGVAKVGNDYKFDLLSGFVDTSNFVNKSSTSGLIKNDGTIDTTDYADKSEMSITDGTGADLGTSTIQLKSGTSKKVLTEHQDVTGKADKVQNATNNNLATLDGFGNLKDSGKAITDIIPNGGTTGQVLAKHSNTDGDVEWKDVQSGEVKAKATYDTTPATKAHAVDSFIYFNNVVYKVTSAIAIGDTIAVGTNISADTGLVEGTQMYIDNLPGEGGGGQTIPDGSTILPVNNVGVWAKCAGQETQYTQLSQVLADSVLLGLLISNQNACDYLVRSTSWVSDISNDEDSMEMIGLNNYCSDTLLADSTWRNAICGSTYFESVLNVKVPTMTSNTTPSGSVSASENLDGSIYKGYYAFDDNASTAWYGSKDSIGYPWIGYSWGKSVKVCKCVLNAKGNSPAQKTYSFKMIGTNDDSTLNDISEVSSRTIASETTPFDVSFNVNVYQPYEKIRLYTKDNGIYSPVINTIQFYGRQDV